MHHILIIYGKLCRTVLLRLPFRFNRFYFFSFSLVFFSFACFLMPKCIHRHRCVRIICIICSLFLSPCVCIRCKEQKGRSTHCRHVRDIFEITTVMTTIRLLLLLLSRCVLSLAREECSCVVSFFFIFSFIFVHCAYIKHFFALCTP